MDVPGLFSLLLLGLEVPDGDGAEQETKDGDGGHPDVNEAGRKVVAERTQRTPAFLVAAEGLLDLVHGGEIVAAELLDRAEARYRAGVKQALLCRIGIHCFGRGDGRVTISIRDRRARGPFTSCSISGRRR